MNTQHLGSYTEKILQNILRAADVFDLFDDIGFLALSKESPVRSVLVGFSGGADSTALLHALKTLNEGSNSPFSQLKLYAVHVNHMIRGEEADRDEKFCRDFCEKHGIPLFVRSENIPKLAAESGESIEEAARRVRYGAFDSICRENNIDFIATAHNSGDNLETMLFNLARGAGTVGIAGIPPKRGNIVRPLILCSKTDIIEYCRENNTGFVVDSTNSDTVYSRNYIRSELVPRLKTLNPEIEQSANRLSQTLRQDDDLLSSLADEYLSEESCEKLAKLHPALLSRVLIKKYKRASELYSSVCGQLTFDHINQLAKVLQKHKNTSCDLPGMITAKITADKLSFVPTKRDPGINISYRYELHEGENCIPEADLRIIITNDEKYINQNINIYKLFIHKFLNFAKMNGKLYVRCRLEGDRIRFGNDENSRSVKKLFSDAASPSCRFAFRCGCAQRLRELYGSPEFRSAVPFICDDSGIVYIPDFPSRDDIVTDDKRTDNAVHLYIIAE